MSLSLPGMGIGSRQLAMKLRGLILGSHMVHILSHKRGRPVGAAFAVGQGQIQRCVHPTATEVWIPAPAYAGQALRGNDRREDGGPKPGRPLKRRDR